MSYVVGLRFKRQGIREIVEVCILTLGHSFSRTHASYPSCVTAYPRGSRSRVFTVSREKPFGPAPENAAHCERCRRSGQSSDTNKRYPAARKISPANPNIFLFDQVQDRSSRTPLD